jgi:hypothetical protein
VTRHLVPLLWAGCLVAGSAHAQVPAANPQRATSALELDAYVGLGRMVAPQVDHAGETSRTNGGPGGSIGAVYRTRYFLAPFVEVGAWSLYAAEQTVDLGSAGGMAAARSSLWAISLVAGPAFDLGPLRGRAAIGLFDLRVSSKVAGQEANTGELDMGYAFALSGFFVRTSRVRVGLEGRLLTIPKAGTTMVTVGPTFGADVLNW